MPQLQRLRADHAPELLEFELANRTYFAASISDRGDEYFERFAERHKEMLAEQEAGRGAYYVLVDDDGSILGRFNLFDMDIHSSTAELGYRVAERAAGRGVATAAVRDVCYVAATEFGLRKLRARTTQENVASQRVLARSGFVRTGEGEVAGQTGLLYERDLFGNGA